MRRTAILTTAAATERNPEYGAFFFRLLERLGAEYALTREHYQQIGQVDGDRVFASYVPARRQPGHPLPFRLEWRRQTGGEPALRRIQVAYGGALEARFGHRLEWDYEPGRKAALLHLWYDGPEGDIQAQLEWAAENAPRLLAALEAGALAAAAAK
jgi:hypothetical protein